MFKTLKWVYRLGVLHERRRVKLLIAQYRTDRPQEVHFSSEKEFREAEAVWFKAGHTLEKIVEPENFIQQYQPAPIDDDSLRGAE